MESFETRPKEHPATNGLPDIQPESRDLESASDAKIGRASDVGNDQILPSPHLDIQPIERPAELPSVFYSDVQAPIPENAGTSMQDAAAPQEPLNSEAKQEQTMEQTLPIETVPAETAVAKQPTIESTQPTAAPPSRPSDEELERKLNEEQLKYCDVVLKTLKKHRDAGPFSVPVDPIALGIPDYPMIIKNPMDLSTVERKLLETKEYKNQEEFISDIKLMLSNCYTYNPPETIVYKRGKNLEKQLENSLKKMPTRESVLAALQAPLAPSGVVADKKRKASTTSLAGSASIVGGPAPKQRAVAHTGSPSVGGETPKPRRSASVKQGTKSFTEEMKHCMNVWKEITKKANIVWPFMQPVDPVALGIPDYFTIIKEPMDFGSIKKKIESGAYSGFSDFEHDVRLVFSNCYTYNAPTSDVVALCKQIEAIFDAKLASALPKSKSFVAPEESADESGDDSDTETLKNLKQQLAQIKSQIASITQKRKLKKASTPAAAAAHTTATSTGLSGATKPHKPEKGAGGSAAVPKKEKKIPPLDEVTFEEKQQLSYDVSFLPTDLLTGVVEIIQECLPSIRNSSEEIELDLDVLDTKTIRKLQAFVQKHRPLGVPKPTQQHPPVSSTSEESDSD